jgi:hypothetical protein
MLCLLGLMGRVSTHNPTDLAQFSALAEVQRFSAISSAAAAARDVVSSSEKKGTSGHSVTQKNPQTLDWTDQQQRQDGIPTKHLLNSAEQEFAHPKYSKYVVVCFVCLETKRIHI